MNVVEIFSSIQGEGINMGKRATFVRLAGCNLSCQFCDTRYALSPKCGTEISVDDVWGEVLKVDLFTNLIVFTGGEPMLQAEAIGVFIWREPIAVKYNLETNGTIFSSFPRFEHVTISPKLATACKNGYDLVTLQEWVTNWASGQTLEFKFVVTHPDDLEEIASLLERLDVPQVPVIFQPDGFKEPYDQALRELLEWTENNPYFKHRARVLPQLHRIMWGQKRGV